MLPLGPDWNTGKPGGPSKKVTFLASDLPACTTATIIIIDGATANRGPVF